MSIVRNSGDNMLFREDFWNSTMVNRNDGIESGTPTISDGLSGGSVIWYGKAHSFIQNLPVTVVAKVRIEINGNNQALFSIGTGASRSIEFGIDATGHPYIWGTGVQSLIGLALSDGTYDIAFIINKLGTVNIIVDGQHHGSGAINLTNVIALMCVGGSCLGTLPWFGEIFRIRAYRNEDLQAAVSMMGRTEIVSEVFNFTTTKQTQSWQLNLTAGSVYTFDWGDGVVDWYIGTGALQTVTHNYASAGTYKIKLRLDNPLALTDFRCDSNNLSGTLPSFAACVNLVTFLCRTNTFSGTLPSFAACVKLSTFLTGTNTFSGTLPSFAACVKLSTFNISTNTFSGTLPSFAACAVLSIFQCHINTFSDYAPGVMPTPCASWRGESNQFPGTAVDAILADFEINIAARPATGSINVGGVGNAALGAAGLASRDAIWAEKGALNWPITHN